MAGVQDEDIWWVGVRVRVRVAEEECVYTLLSLYLFRQTTRYISSESCANIYFSMRLAVRDRNILVVGAENECRALLNHA